MLLSNIFNNMFDDFVNSSNKKDDICCYQTKNVINFSLPSILKSRITKNRASRRRRILGYSEIKKKALSKNRVADYSKTKETATRKNKVISYFEIEKNLENKTNKNMSKINFLFSRKKKYD